MKVELVVGQVYVLSGWLFDDYALESNDNKFTYVGSEWEDEYRTAKFCGVNNNIQQWSTHETLFEDEDVSCTLYQAE